MGRITLVLGGARSGKSAFAEELAGKFASRGAAVVYLATCDASPGTPGGADAEMEERIARHRARRPASWTTVEEPLAPETHASELPSGTVLLVDCVSLWVSNLLLAIPEGERDASDRILSRVRLFLEAAAASAGDVILVSGETGCGVVPVSPLGRLYRDILGWTNQEIARAADDVWFLVAGLPQRLK